MTRDDIICIAKEAGFHVSGQNIQSPFVDGTNLSALFASFATLVAAAEREECAKVCEVNHGTIKANLSSFECASAIRARSQA